MPMKIVSAKDSLTQVKGVEGLFSCKMTHEIKKTAAKFDYTGPKFDPNMWRQVLAFFKWTNDTNHSEAQVRLFVHPEEGWKAWAFPQEGGTGMTTREMDTPEAKTQRAQFGDGWLLYGTVHHHCSAGAFQSGTDEANESNQEGIHITVGNMDKPQHSLHCRFYYQGCKFEPDMSAFWDVSVALEAIPDSVIPFLVDNFENRLAMEEMGVSSALGTVFPEAWKNNYIIPKRETFPLHPNYHGGVGSWEPRGSGRGKKKGYDKYDHLGNDTGLPGFPSRALKDLFDIYRKKYPDGSEVDAGDMLVGFLRKLDDIPEVHDFLAAIKKHACTLDDMVDKAASVIMQESIRPEQAQEELEKRWEEMTEEEKQDAMMQAYGGGM